MRSVGFVRYHVSLPSVSSCTNSSSNHDSHRLPRMGRGDVKAVFGENGRKRTDFCGIFSVGDERSSLLEILKVSSVPVLLQIVQPTVCTRFLRVADANRNEMLAHAWEAKTLTSKRETREDSLYQGIRQFCSRNSLLSTPGTFAW